MNLYNKLVEKLITDESLNEFEFNGIKYTRMHFIKLSSNSGEYEISYEPTGPGYYFYDNKKIKNFNIEELLNSFNKKDLKKLYWTLI